MVGGKIVEDACSFPHSWEKVENLKFWWRDKQGTFSVEYCNDSLQHSLKIIHKRRMYCRCCVRCNLANLCRSLEDLCDDVVGLRSDMVDLFGDHQTLLDNIQNAIHGVNNELAQQNHQIANIEVELNEHLLVVDSNIGPSLIASRPIMSQ